MVGLERVLGRLRRRFAVALALNLARFVRRIVWRHARLAVAVVQHALLCAELSNWRLVELGRVLGTVWRRLAVTLALHCARVVRWLVLDLGRLGLADVQHWLLPTALPGWHLVAMGLVLRNVWRWNALAQPSRHCGGGVWRQRVSDRLVRVGAVRRIVLRCELRAQCVVDVVGVH